MVHPCYQRRGLGTLLLTSLLETIPPKMPVQLCASVDGAKLYEKHGFELVDILKIPGWNFVDLPVYLRNREHVRSGKPLSC